MPGYAFFAVVALAALSGAPSARVAADNLDFTAATVCIPGTLGHAGQKAVAMLLDEVERRTQVRWRQQQGEPSRDAVAIIIRDATPADPLPENAARPEGFALRALNDHQVLLTPRDPRGCLFGIGRLLREMRMERGSIRIPAALNIATAPVTPLRGHQLGYRPKTNSYDAWTPQMWEQYIRDLAVFGTNAIELLPPRTDDAPTSPHFPLPQLEMMKRMAQICDDYGLDVWVWYPALDKDYGDPATVDFALKEWGEVFAALPRIDAVFVPGGDPGHTDPKLMMALLEKQTLNLHKTHPNAQMWMSPQGFTKAWMDEFLEYMRAVQPKWLTGIVFGPQNRMLLKDLRAALPAQYLIRHYPDITHTIQCQFPVPDWDYAYAITEQREPINPRPTQYARIFSMFNEGTIGFITYSEGCNDDINKIVWSSLGWDPAADVPSILRDYARYFIGPKEAGDFAQGILGLEQDWTGPLLTNAAVMNTLAQFQALETRATPQQKLNWRFQQALYRAYYDAYDYCRLSYEAELEQQAMEALRDAPKLGALHALDAAEKILDKAVTAPVGQDLRARVFALAEALFQSVHMQLSVPRYQAIQVDRGANLDLIDTPLNDRVWLKARFAEIRKIDGELTQRNAIDGIVNWRNPGPGGFYDDLGNPSQHPHLVRAAGYVDPEYKSEPLMARDYDPAYRNSWSYYAETRYESPLKMQYDNLDPEAVYKVRVIYAGDTPERKIRLLANGIEIHGYISKPLPPKPLEFDIPRAQTASGKLTLAWNQEPGRGGNGRGCQVAEVWLLKSAQ